jgi:hypothetical protein
MASKITKLVDTIEQAVGSAQGVTSNAINKAEVHALFAGVKGTGVIVNFQARHGLPLAPYSTIISLQVRAAHRGLWPGGRN